MNNKRDGASKSSLHNFFPKNNKGQELSTNTIILIILGIAILVILIIGFTTGWSFFKNIITPTNVDSVVQDCESLCGTDQKFSFCSAERTLRVNEEKLEVKTSCYIMANSATFAKYDIATCPSIDCDLACEELVIGSKSGVVADSSEGAKYDLTSLASNLEQGKSCIVN
jgi:hypothetical protein